MSLYSSSKHKARSSSKSSLGHLKLSVFEEASCLVVEVYEARCLAKKESNSAETYVKLYLLPDPNKLTKQKTKMCKGKDPTYNQKFNFLLENGDETKQLYISIWVHDRGSRNELVGCMSFHVADILKSETKIHGWYQLLDRDKGLSENAKVLSLRVPTEQGPTAAPSAQLNGRTFAVTLARGPSGYGFSVHSSHPVYITAVDEGLPAHAAGVQVNDVLIELEGIDVRHASGKQAVNIIRRCRDTLAMILLRCGSSLSLNRSQSIADGLTAKSLSISLSPTLFSSQSDIPRIDAKRRLSNVEQISDMGYGSTSSLNAMHHRAHAPRRSSLSPEPLIHLKQPSSNSSIEEEYELTADSHTVHTVGRPVHLTVEGTHHGSLSKLSPKTSAPSSQESLPAPPQHQKYLSMSSLATTVHQNSPQHVNLSYHTQLSSSGDSLDGGHVSFARKGVHKFSSYDNVISTHNVQLLSSKKLKSDDQLDIRWDDLTPKEKRQQKAIDELVVYEAHYCSVLKTGIKSYKEPITSSKVIPSPQMQNIFTNIDELYEISNGICVMLKQKQKPYADTAPLSYHIETFADVYKLKWLHLKKSYETYLKCFSAASQELSLCLTKPEMSRFLQQVTTKDQSLPSLHHILDQPRQYFMDLLKHLINVDSHTQLQSKDHQPMTQLINDLLELCPDKQLVSKYRRQQDVIGNLKLRIGFSSAVQPAVVVTPGRIFIQEGEMTLLEKKKKRKVWLLLFNNLLLITRKDGKIFTVQEEAIQLDDVRLTNITGGSDLHLYVKEKEITLRAISPAVQAQWQSKLLELLAALRPVGVPQANLTHEAHVNSMNKVMGNEDERTSQLAKMTRIADAQKQDAFDGKFPNKGTRRRTLFNISKSNVAKQKLPARRTVSESTTNVTDQKEHTFENISPEVLKMWSKSFDALLQNPDGAALFEQFLISEFSEENLQFWQACKRYQTNSVNNSSLSVHVEARAIYNEFLVQGAPKQVNLDHETLAEVSRNIDRANHTLFEKAQKSVYSLMSIDSYKRFVQSSRFQQALLSAK